MASEDDDRPRKKVSHEIGQDLSLLSVEELTERLALNFRAGAYNLLNHPVFSNPSAWKQKKKELKR